MPRILLPAIVLAVLLGAVAPTAGIQDAKADDCSCSCSCNKCMARRAGKPGKGCGLFGCGCGHDGQRIPSLRQVCRCPGACCQENEYGNPDLFYNYYADPTCGTVSAQMYLAPRPVPPLVGHTYITYQPLMPHEFLYTHHRTYHRYYNGGRGLTRANVHWYSSPLQNLCDSAIQAVKLPR
jgi:hypothetical protein